MLKGHPKGLLVAFFANMGERFGFYTMMAILVLFLQAKFGLSGTNAGWIYSTFYAAIYLLSVVGGIMADRFIGMGKTITLGILIMGGGYLLVAIPGLGLIPVCIGLFTIALGNGLFKGNLQAVVGNLYEDKKYAHLRDSAFSLFYMGINIGALFAPTAALEIKDYILKTQGYLSDNALPKLCHTLIDGGSVDTATFTEMANKATIAAEPVTDLTQFANDYINAFSTGYNYAFGFAAVMMAISLVVYFAFNKYLKPGFEAFSTDNSDGHAVPELSKAEVKERLIALGLVFGVCIFFWMSFHQNGLTLTFFARDYTATSAAANTYFWFDIWILLPFFGAAVGAYMIVNFLKNHTPAKDLLLGTALLAGLGYLGYYQYMRLAPTNAVSPETFLHLNPFFIVSLTPVVVGIFAALNKRNMEPSAPRKIGYGMIITAVGFAILLAASLNLDSPATLNQVAAPEEMRVTPYWMISVYFTLTIAELFLSPMGISFVSKVAPPNMKGTMQAGWLCATAAGNALLGIGSFLWERIELYYLWAFFIVCCILSAIFIFSVMKRLERVTKNA